MNDLIILDLAATHHIFRSAAREARVRESAAVRSTEQASTSGGRCWEANQSLESLVLKAYEGATKKLYEDLSLHIEPR